MSAPADPAWDAQVLALAGPGRAPEIEAFLRRIPYKIAIENPSIDQFTQIFELNCRTPKS